MARKVRPWALSLVLAGTLAGCASIPREALQLSPESLQERQLQTRRFETQDEGKLLSASASLLQDLGFIIEKSETSLGVIVASKERSALSAGQVAIAGTSILLSILLTVILDSGGHSGGVIIPPPPIDKTQKMRASVVTRPIGDGGKSTAVRVTFQRIVWDIAGNISRAEHLNDPRIYQEFFSKLSKAVFLEAHEL